ncbi:MAG: SpoVR family protein [Chloroflexi bacterium]|nr:SpoVR family protein [Chloroflexota bacterium]
MFEDRLIEIEKLAQAAGLKPFDTYFEVIPLDIMHEIAAYGLPTRAQHWSYGKVYNHHKIHGEMGLSKIYEIVLNNDPCYAFLLDTNDEIENLLVGAHVLAHSDFFRNNVYFDGTNRNMVNEAVDHARRIDEYIERYGLERVEHLMDMGFALDRHLDSHKGLNRKRYPGREVVEKEVVRGAYADLFGEDGLSLGTAVIGEKLPPHAEKDVLWFLANYAPVEEWEKDVLEIIREEAYYFFPQFETKVLNEGWASFWHAELLNRYVDLSPKETIEFARLHAGVVTPGSPLQLNPYYLGYKILVDIKERWDASYAAGEAKLDGWGKLFEVRATENDISFLSNYLTPELAGELKLLTYGYADEEDADEEDIEIKSREYDEIIRQLLAPRYNYGAPKIVITEVERGELHLRHEKGSLGDLDQRYAEKTLGYLYELWKAPIYLETTQGDKRVKFFFGPNGLRVEAGIGGPALSVASMAA